MNIKHAVVSFGLLAAAISPVAVSQTAPTDGKQPTAIGVSQEKANEANRKAVQNGDAATLVRTGPTAADKAGEMTDKAKASATDMKDKAKSKARSATPDQ